MKTSLEKTWDKQTDYLGNWQFREKDIYENNILMNWLRKLSKDRVLDAGCGVGPYTIYPAKLGFKVTGIDISKDCLEQARKNLKKYNVKAKLVLGDVRKLPFKNNSFTAVLSTGVVEHFNETQQAINEAYRVLKPEGELLIYVPNKFTIFRINKMIQQVLGLWKAGYEKSFLSSKFKKMLEKSGFKVEEIKRTKIFIGKNKFIGRVLRVLDWPLWIIGLGGQNLFFRAVKSLS